MQRHFWILSIILLMGCSSFRSEPPVIGQLPEFELVNQNGQPVGLKDYQGKVWVANFIFTSCAGTCPMLTQRMKKVQEAIESMGSDSGNLPLKIVSFSVDPERDNPKKLADYAKSFKVNTEVWSFVTGPVDGITEMVVKGFKISMGKVPRGTANSGAEGKLKPGEIFDVIHGEKFILVDDKGQIRGYYDSDRKGINRLIADLKYLYKKIS